ncbi:Protein of unknown function [Lishizhenia tianjinensis]|uniref:DNA-binding protein n=1 Tax=Lishizhenia tianjinensis TaxID=477690 RepID=A0A1I6YXH3_9FLAO|nr:DUF3276 family protein [Lishizhenia tianjinensis]SFT55166.1 Protein of unknown function [Lishizhenia tianjinensis]
MDETNRNDRNEEVFSKVVRAGKRTYFFDIKSTRGNDLYLTLTESKKSMVNGRMSFQKHKIFLYKEDFEKFSDGLQEVIEKIAELKASGAYKNEDEEQEEYTTVSFDDL